MTSKKELRLAYGLAIVLLVVGAASYAFTALTAKPSDEPVRIMYASAAGRVLYDHQTHVAADTGYGISCADCHHHPPDDDSALRACSDCHVANPEEGQLPEACLECHDAEDVEDTEMPNTGDAFHGQCIQCHKEVGGGATECSDCHML